MLLNLYLTVRRAGPVLCTEECVTVQSNGTQMVQGAPYASSELPYKWLLERGEFWLIPSAGPNSRAMYNHNISGNLSFGSGLMV